MEQWEKIKDFHYEVSSEGRVRNTDTGKILKQQMRNNYLAVRLYSTGVSRGKLYDIHRLVAEAFIPNPKNLSQINHKSEVKTDNFVENLEWCESEYNCNYGERNRKIGDAHMKKVWVITPSGEKLIFDSCVSAEKHFDLKPNVISASIRQYGHYKDMLVGYVSNN